MQNLDFNQVATTENKRRGLLHFQNEAAKIPYVAYVIFT